MLLWCVLCFALATQAATAMKLLKISCYADLAMNSWGCRCDDL